MISRLSGKFRKMMYQYGFIYDYEFCGYIKEGYGMFLTNTDKFDNNENYLEKMQNDKFYREYLNRGFELVIGPAAPAVNGQICSKSAVYIKNYEIKPRNKLYSKQYIEHTKKL